MKSLKVSLWTGSRPNMIKQSMKKNLFVSLKQVSLLLAPLFQGSVTLSWRRPLSYRNQFIDFQSKSMDWFLYDRDLRHEKVKRSFDNKNGISFSFMFKIATCLICDQYFTYYRECYVYPNESPSCNIKL